MGAWDSGVFDNDDAADWINELADANDLEILNNAIYAVLDTPDYIEEPEGARLLCACEVVTAFRGKLSTNIPDEVRQWVKNHESLDTSPLIPAALQAIDRVLGDDSELKQLWEENEQDYPKWHEAILSIKRRLYSLMQPDNVS
ncbi:DUF4259 domain-containing protein [Methylomonas methanica]|uniref:DUF4259 domain-containing protein n=1 Tax=Methylomonas methanica (strain DSM 25384 / MC09) TaxID=857087 RepID=G0A3Y8_METMM|nr:DUF4259 domain-containing protein [Methylomonas methanica]AEG02760.1 hypothetical protein Metme_4417 [Methylomonas methanica MC09]